MQARRKAAWVLGGVLILLTGWAVGSDLRRSEATMEFRSLTEEEARIIERKGTEAPFSGAYVHHHEDGTYTCKRCGALLYRSGDKFESGCGWPSFDDAVPGAVREQADADGRRTEIVCAHCGAHLGHVFRGEGFTPKETRHCVNSLSLQFVAATAATEDAYFAGGCFWGVEYYFERAPGVLSAESGYMGGALENPTYEDVKRQASGHAETVHVVFDPRKTSYAALAKLFFEIHDPTQANRQGPDIGSSYRSAVFVTNEAQREAVTQLIAALRGKGYAVVTEVRPAETFWKAESYHQDYYARTGKQPYCHVRVKRFD